MECPFFKALFAYFVVLAYENGWKHAILPSFRVKKVAKRCPKSIPIIIGGLIRKTAIFANTAFFKEGCFCKVYGFSNQLIIYDRALFRASFRLFSREINHQIKEQRIAWNNGMIN